MLKSGLFYLVLPYFCSNEGKITLYQCLDGIDDIVRNILSIYSLHGAFGQAILRKKMPSRLPQPQNRIDTWSRRFGKMFRLWICVQQLHAKRNKIFWISTKRSCNFLYFLLFQSHYPRVSRITLCPSGTTAIYCINRF